MSENRSYRINTNINKDNVVNVQISQDIDCLEILSLKINQVDTYRLQSANYGVIVGRVLANDGFGVPNVKVSVFIELDKVDKENPDITTIYPYTSMQTRDKDGRKYNLLLDNDNGNGDCYRIVGTFPNKRLVLDNENQLEVFDKYWKYTTVTNNAGDYMIFGVPVGVHTVHIDCDLSDIGILSQKPRDFYYKGYEKTNFENASQFKASTTLEDLVQIISQDKSIQVYPFWGDKDNSDVIALSRCDLNLAYKFEPTCVFMGSVITDDYSNAIGHTCSPSKKVGYNNRLTTNRGTIEMIRKTPDGAVEEYQVQGNELIDGDGVWCYQIPMNLDYIKTDEYGNIVPTDNPNEGIPTRTCARFRISIEDTYNEGIGRHRAKVLVPNNLDIQMDESSNIKLVDDAEWEKCFQFGSRTPENQYRDLYWNKIYSIKSYIPRIQTNNNVKTHNYSAIRSVNLDTTNNPHPFNRIRLHVPFTYTVLCVLMKIVFLLALVINATIISLLNTLAEICIPPVKIKILGIKLYWCVFEFLETDCISFKFPGVAQDGGDECYIPGCWNSAAGQGSCSTNYKRLSDRLEQALAQEYNVVNLDFYNDWVNGTVYMPLWFWKKTKKKKYLFGLFRKKAVNSFCNCSRNFGKPRIFETCALEKNPKFKPKNGNAKNPDKLKNSFLFRYGVIKEFQNKDGLNVYYYVPGIRNHLGYYGRLYSTDIILLGGFMDCDLDGVTNICDKLPSTTANIPFLTTIREQPENGGDDIFSDVVPGGDSVGGRIEEENTDESTEDETVLSQAVEITGMDWTYKGKNSNPTYKDGLFFDIGCGKTETRTKTCINLSRISELGVSLDSGYYTKYPSGNGFKEKYIQPDGMILRHELDDIDTRAAFATMNHNVLVGKVENPNTKYKSYLLYYTYPMNFDGAMDSAIRAYGVDFEDFQDESYVKFRYGLDVENTNSLNLNQVIRYNDNFLLTNNSFYFYFGLHPGKTAIEKYQELYNANCLINKKHTQVYDIAVKNSSGCENDGEITIDFAYIRPPYTITMSYININGNKESVKFKKSDSNAEEYYTNIEGKCDSPTTSITYEDKIKSELRKIKIQNLTNQDYTIKIVDVNGREVTEIVELNPTIVSINEVVGQQVDVKYIPNSNQKVSGGTIYLGDWIYEGEQITPNNIAPTASASKYTIIMIDGKNFELRISFKSMYPNDETQWKISDCIQSAKIVDNKVVFDINIPGYYEFEIQRLCDCNMLDDGIYYDRVLVPNNIQFQLRLNGTPVDSIVGGWKTNWGEKENAQYPFNVHVGDTYYDSDLVPTNPIAGNDEFKMVTRDGKSYVTKNNILLWKDYVNELIEMVDDSSFFETQNTNITAKISQLTRQISSIKEKISELIEEQNSVLSTISEKKDEVENKKNEKQLFEDKLNRIKSLPSKIEVLQTEIETLRIELDELDEGLLKELRRLEAQKLILSNEKVRLQTQLDSEKDEVTKELIMEQLTIIEQELVSVQAAIRVEKAKTEVAEVLDEYTRISSEKTSKELELSSLQDEYNAISGNTSSYQEKIGKLQKEINDLEDKIGTAEDAACDSQQDSSCTLYGYYNHLNGKIEEEEKTKLENKFSNLANFDGRISELQQEIDDLINEIGTAEDDACDKSQNTGCTLYAYYNYLNGKIKEEDPNNSDLLTEFERIKTEINSGESELRSLNENLDYEKSLKSSYDEFKKEQEEINTHNLYKVLEFRLKCILQMSKGMYTHYNASAPYFKLTTKGGENPCVICSEYPDYGECEFPDEELLRNPNKASMGQVIHSSSVTKIQGKSSFPTIVPKNYGSIINIDKGFVSYSNNNSFNKLILKGSELVGNYVAAFDDNMQPSCHTQPTNPIPQRDAFSDMTEIMHHTINSSHTENFSKTQFIDTSIDYKFTVISPLTSDCIIEGINDGVQWGNGYMRGNIMGGIKMKSSSNDNLILSGCSIDVVTGETCNRPTEYVYHIDKENQFVLLKSLDIDHNEKCTNECSKRKNMHTCKIYYDTTYEDLIIDNYTEMCDKTDFASNLFKLDYNSLTSGLKKSDLLKPDNHGYFSKKTYPEVTCLKFDEIPSGTTNVGVKLASYSYDIYPELNYNGNGYASGITLNASVGEELDIDLISENSLSVGVKFGSIIRYNFPLSISDLKTSYVKAVNCRFSLKSSNTGKSYTKQLIGCRMTTANETSFNDDEGYLDWNDTDYFSGSTFSERIDRWEKLTSWQKNAPFRLDYSGEDTEYSNGYLRNKDTKEYLDDSYVDGDFMLKTSNIDEKVNSFAIFAKNSRFGEDVSNGDLHLKQVTQYQILQVVDVRPFELATLFSNDKITGGVITSNYNTLILGDDIIEGLENLAEGATILLNTAASGTSATTKYNYINLYDCIKVYTNSNITEEDNIVNKDYYDIQASVQKKNDMYVITHIILTFKSGETVRIEDAEGNVTCYQFQGLREDDSFLDLANPKVYVGVTCANEMTYLFLWNDYKLIRDTVNCPE